jgi:hypothetical protein
VKWQVGEGGALERAITSHGVRIQVAIEDPALAAAVDLRLPPGHRCAPFDADYPTFRVRRLERERYEVEFAASLLQDEADAAIALRVLGAEVRSFLAQRVPQHVFVHAGVVALDGRAIVLPGRSFAGKTTLVGALLRAGATYYSDELMVLDTDGLAHPYACPLSVRGDDPLRPTATAAAALGAPTGEHAVPIGLVATTAYVPGASWRPHAQTPASGAVALMANTPAARQRPEQVLAVLRRAIAGALVLSGDRGEADETAALLIDASRAGGDGS